MESIVRRILRKYFDSFLKNFDSDRDFQFSSFKGETSLENLEVNENVIQEVLGINTIIVKSFKIKKCHLKIPVTKLKSEPIRVTIDRVDVELQEPYEFEPVPKVIASLLGSESTSDFEDDDTRGGEGDTGGGGGGSAYGRTQKIVDGIRIFVSSVRVSFFSLSKHRSRSIGPWTPPLTVLYIEDVLVTRTDDRFNEHEHDLHRCHDFNRKREKVYVFQKISVGAIKVCLERVPGGSGPALPSTVMTLTIDPITLTTERDRASNSVKSQQADVRVRSVKSSLTAGQAAFLLDNFAYLGSSLGRENEYFKGPEQHLLIVFHAAYNLDVAKPLVEFRMGSIKFKAKKLEKKMKSSNTFTWDQPFEWIVHKFFEKTVVVTVSSKGGMLGSTSTLGIIELDFSTMQELRMGGPIVKKRVPVYKMDGSGVLCELGLSFRVQDWAKMPKPRCSQFINATIDAVNIALTDTRADRRTIPVLSKDVDFEGPLTTSLSLSGIKLSKMSQTVTDETSLVRDTIQCIVQDIEVSTQGQPCYSVLVGPQTPFPPLLSSSSTASAVESLSALASEQIHFRPSHNLARVSDAWDKERSYSNNPGLLKRQPLLSLLLEVAAPPPGAPTGVRTEMDARFIVGPLHLSLLVALLETVIATGQAAVLKMNRKRPADSVLPLVEMRKFGFEEAEARSNGRAVETVLVPDELVAQAKKEIEMENELNGSRKKDRVSKRVLLPVLYLHGEVVGFVADIYGPLPPPTDEFQMTAKSCVTDVPVIVVQLSNIFVSVSPVFAAHMDPLLLRGVLCCTDEDEFPNRAPDMLFKRRKRVQRAKITPVDDPPRLTGAKDGQSTVVGEAEKDGEEEEEESPKEENAAQAKPAEEADEEEDGVQKEEEKEAEAGANNNTDGAEAVCGGKEWMQEEESPFGEAELHMNDEGADSDCAAPKGALTQSVSVLSGLDAGMADQDYLSEMSSVTDDDYVLHFKVWWDHTEIGLRSNIASPRVDLFSIHSTDLNAQLRLQNILDVLVLDDLESSLVHGRKQVSGEFFCGQSGIKHVSGTITQKQGVILSQLMNNLKNSLLQYTPPQIPILQLSLSLIEEIKSLLMQIDAILRQSELVSHIPGLFYAAVESFNICLEHVKEDGHVETVGLILADNSEVLLENTQQQCVLKALARTVEVNGVPYPYSTALTTLFSSTVNSPTHFLALRHVHTHTPIHAEVQVGHTLPDYARLADPLVVGTLLPDLGRTVIRIDELAFDHRMSAFISLLIALYVPKSELTSALNQKIQQHEEKGEGGGAGSNTDDVSGSESSLMSSSASLTGLAAASSPSLARASHTTVNLSKSKAYFISQYLEQIRQLENTVEKLQLAHTALTTTVGGFDSHSLAPQQSELLPYVSSAALPPSLAMHYVQQTAAAVRSGQKHTPPPSPLVIASKKKVSKQSRLQISQPLVSGWVLKQKNTSWGSSSSSSSKKGSWKRYYAVLTTDGKLLYLASPENTVPKREMTITATTHLSADEKAFREVFHKCNVFEISSEEVHSYDQKKESKGKEGAKANDGKKDKAKKKKEKKQMWRFAVESDGEYISWITHITNLVCQKSGMIAPSTSTTSLVSLANEDEPVPRLSAENTSDTGSLCSEVLEPLPLSASPSLPLTVVAQSLRHMTELIEEVKIQKNLLCHSLGNMYDNAVSVRINTLNQELDAAARRAREDLAQAHRESTALKASLQMMKGAVRLTEARARERVKEQHTHNIGLGRALRHAQYFSRLQLGVTVFVETTHGRSPPQLMLVQRDPKDLSYRLMWGEISKRKLSNSVLLRDLNTISVSFPEGMASKSDNGEIVHLETSDQQKTVSVYVQDTDITMMLVVGIARAMAEGGGGCSQHVTMPTEGSVLWLRAQRALVRTAHRQKESAETLLHRLVCAARKATLAFTLPSF